MNGKYICIHGHFYQPPRENPWLEEVELQESAYPFHDWNERITAQCYAPNTASRILDHNSRIIDIVNNYSKISFNFGPTLLSWLQAHQPEVYEAILEADRLSVERHNGHGSALAQAYNHLIMPLANRRDKLTQVKWGIRDFQSRFRRDPEGMWLSETAVDLETLDIMADHGITFTVLAPRQASRVRPLKNQEWEDVSGDRVDPTRPYLCRLPSGRDMTLFFYDGPISKAVAFEGLLSSGEALAGRLMSGFAEGREHDQLVHIATDGETYGHHHRHGDMALAYALYHIETETEATPTIYAEYMEKHPPEYEAEIFENSSWSCVHGVERWRADCGCSSGMHPGWHQKWRKPLRDSLDMVRDSVAPIYDAYAKALFKDPWAARDEYISVILDRSEDNADAFLEWQAGRKLSEEERVKALKYLELQRHAMLMYTSCGWFFDEISGIETTQIMAYAARTIQLAGEVAGADLEKSFKDILENAPSNIPEFGNGAVVFDSLVKPGYLDLERVGAHFAIASLFERDIDAIRIYCYRQEGLEHEFHEAGTLRMSTGRTSIVSAITGERNQIGFAAMYLGGHNAACGIQRKMSPEDSAKACSELGAAFEKSDIPELVRVLDKHYEHSDFSLWHLFKDEQRKVLDEILAQPVEAMEAAFGQEFERNYTTMVFLKEIGQPLPRAFARAAELSINSELDSIFLQDRPDTERIRQLSELARKWKVSLDKDQIGLIAGESITSFMEEAAENLCDLDMLEYLNDLIRAAKTLPLDLDLWRAQNIYFRVSRKEDQEELSPEEAECRAGERFKSAMADLSECLGVKA